MKPQTVQSVRNALISVVLFGLVPAAYGVTLYAANNGVDGASCGPTASPCRSITRAIANADPGDTVMVRAGLYGDLNGDGVLGQTGEETPSSGCGCMLSINKSVTLMSSDGAAATLIDATSFNAGKNVLIIAGDVEFGRPEHGFLVTNAGDSGSGIVVDGTDVKIRGNLIVKNKGATSAVGVETVANSSEIVLIEQNQAMGWDNGIYVHDAAKKVSRNQVSMNTVGINATGASVVGNVATGNFYGIALRGAASATGNAVYGNFFGFSTAGFTGAIQKNNIFGNSYGLRNDNVAGLSATGNYWGAATGPGADPADTVLNVGVGSTTTTPFAANRFAINPSFEP